jgi:hypothetical protein
MPKFGVNFGTSVAAFATATTAKTAIRLAPAAKRKVEIVEVRMTGAGTVAPADVQHLCQLVPLSGAGAGTLTAKTIEPMDQGGAAFAATVGVNATAEPTAYSAVGPVTFGFNQRGGDRWAVPRGEGFQHDNADTQLNSGVTVTSSVAGAIDGDLHFWEV